VPPPDPAKIVYTAIAAGRDALKSPGRIPPGWTAVCFTDDPVDHPEWDVRPLPREHEDPVRDARRLKLLPHEAFPGAEVSLWMDGNFAVACDLDALVEEHLGEVDLAFHSHPQRDCVYEEGIACIDRQKDDAATIVRQLLRYARSGYPEHAGLPATGVVLRRHTVSVSRFNAVWWDELSQGSRRDQLAVGWALRERAIPWSTFHSHLWDGPLFQWRRHDGVLKLGAAAA
jgi:hypothetical protein